MSFAKGIFMSASASLASTVTAGSVPRQIFAVIAGSLLLWISAKIEVPLAPVPVTLQTMAVMAIALGFGARMAVLAVALYLAQGALGLPVFAGTPERGIGLAYMMGPTGGYLAGFLATALVVGALADRGWSRNIVLSAIACLIGIAVTYALGLAWLGTIMGYGQPLIAAGLAPFIVPDLVKAAVGAIAAPMVWRLISPRG